MPVLLTATASGRSIQATLLGPAEDDGDLPTAPFVCLTSWDDQQGNRCTAGCGDALADAGLPAVVLDLPIMLSETSATSDHVEILTQALASIGFGGRVSLVGEGWCAGLAIAFALRYGARVKALLLTRPSFAPASRLSKIPSSIAVALLCPQGFDKRQYVKELQARCPSRFFSSFPIGACADQQQLHALVATRVASWAAALPREPVSTHIPSRSLRPIAPLSASKEPNTPSVSTHSRRSSGATHAATYGRPSTPPVSTPQRIASPVIPDRSLRRLFLADTDAPMSPESGDIEGASPPAVGDSSVVSASDDLIDEVESQSPVEQRTPLVTHRGSCHCRAVTFEFTAPAVVDVWICNCSVCAMKRNDHIIVPNSNFRLLSGEEDLTTYTFNTHTARHTFCRICGVQAFYTPRSNPDGKAVTYYCVEPGTIADAHFRRFNGQDWEESYRSSNIFTYSLP
eukprot:TRINITY_DN16518_c0_g1_i1.p1 TRINITY_DN16518_c0_g1~~TRINITY_DN16518_c0_g1_i1.p1  ORF type:complete len:456 (+),score=50.60 TRINITY_DN16518_c0_g1_i1:484-1851(+)